MKRLFIIFLILALPIMVAAKEKGHIKTQKAQECAECHKSQAEAWQNGKHEVMGVNALYATAQQKKTLLQNLTYTSAEHAMVKSQGC